MPSLRPMNATTSCSPQDVNDDAIMMRNDSSSSSRDNFGVVNNRRPQQHEDGSPSTQSNEDKTVVTSNNTEDRMTLLPQASSLLQEQLHEEDDNDDNGSVAQQFRTQPTTQSQTTQNDDDLEAALTLGGPSADFAYNFDGSIRMLEENYEVKEDNDRDEENYEKKKDNDRDDTTIGGNADSSFGLLTQAVAEDDDYDNDDDDDDDNFHACTQEDGAAILESILQEDEEENDDENEDDDIDIGERNGGTMAAAPSMKDLINDVKQAESSVAEVEEAIMTTSKMMTTDNIVAADSNHDRKNMTLSGLTEHDKEHVEKSPVVNEAVMTLKMMTDTFVAADDPKYDRKMTLLGLTEHDEDGEIGSMVRIGGSIATKDRNDHTATSTKIHSREGNDDGDKSLSISKRGLVEQEDKEDVVSGGTAVDDKSSVHLTAEGGNDGDDIIEDKIEGCKHAASLTVDDVQSDNSQGDEIEDKIEGCKHAAASLNVNDVLSEKSQNLDRHEYDENTVTKDIGMLENNATQLTTAAIDCAAAPMETSGNSTLGKSDVDAMLDPNDDNDDHFEGTGDTNIPTQQSDGWSFYDGETQMLPMASSQTTILPPAPSSTGENVMTMCQKSEGMNIDTSAILHSTVMNVDTSAINLLATVVDATEEVCVPQNEQTKSEGTADKNESIVEGSGDVVDDARIQNNDVLFGRDFFIGAHPGNQHLLQLVQARKPDFNAARKKEKEIIAIQIIHDIANLEPPGRFLMEYPLGSVASEKDVHDKVWVIVEGKKVLDKVMHRLREQDNDKACRQHNIMKHDPPENGGKGSPKATSCKMSFVGNVDDNDENFDKMDHVGDEGTTQRSQDLLLASPATAETVKSKNFSSSDKPSVQYDASKSTGASPPSAQKITKKTPHLTKFVDNRSAEWISSARRGLKTKGEKETDSPRLIVPSFKPIKSSLKDRAEMNEEDVIDDIDEDDGSDDDESWSGHRCKNHGEDYVDPIENTQDESNIMVKPSAFERLSRGSTKSTLEFIPPATNDAMKPKLLQYERNDSSSEVEFSHGDDNNSSDDELRQINRKNSHLSQTDQCIREQLREVQDILPSVREIQDIATRKQLLDEIAELKMSHKASIKKLTQEKSKLVTQLKTANDTIRQKEQVIKEKNELLEQQFTVISQITGACQTLSSVPSTKRKRTPLESELHGTKSSSDDDDAPISTLKTNRTYSGKSKKMPCASFACSSSTGATKKVNIGLSPVGSDGSSVKDKNGSNLLSGPIWKKLQEKGWRYMCGPEPYNKVYVPKDGATHSGTQLGIHFFADFDQVIASAIARGDLTEGCSEVKSNDNVSKHRSPVKVINSDKLTISSVYTIIDILTKFVQEDNHDRFVGSFFTPLWICLKDQGMNAAGTTDLSWKWESNRNKLSTRNWCFVPPSSKIGRDGQVCVDYFLTEEQVVLCVLKEISTLKELSSVYADHESSFVSITPVLEVAVNDNLDYLDAKLGKSSSVRSRRASVPLDSPQVRLSPKSGAKRKTPQVKKRKITPDHSSGKKKKTMRVEDESTSPAFHSSQTQGVVTALPSYCRRSPGQMGGPLPLSGLSFFYSGINEFDFAIDEKITKLGGEIVDPNLLSLSSARNKVFFLSDYTSWRTHKYVYANALGTPMLHYQWLVALEQKLLENGTAKPFDSELYTKYRLPRGLDISQGIFPLQRASAARCWDPPGCTRGGEGSAIFHGMTIVLAIDRKHQANWTMVLLACGATVMTCSDMIKGKGRIAIDCCLFASNTLPPHVISVPEYVSKLMQSITDDVPLLDLAWAHQSIIQRRRLPLNGDISRYLISLGHKMSDTCNVSSIKSKAGVRYELGDLVQFNRGAKVTSFGRIASIVWEKKVGHFRLELQLLESCGGNELVDCESSAKIVVAEKSLLGNIVLLGSKDFYRLGYIPKSGQSNIFNRVINESQT